MSSSPFLTPGRSRGPRRRFSRKPTHRRRRRGALAAIAFVILLALALDLLRAGSAAERTRGSAARIPLHRSAARLSPAGLPLASPAFTLTGLGAGAREPVQLGFRRPPREALLFNLQTGQVLWEDDPLRRVRIASLTKMMTALLVVLSEPPTAPVLITRAAVDMPGSKVGVLPLGRHVRLQTLLYGLLLPSGNDAAVALAQHVAGTVNAFVRRMNEEAARLGMGCTRYSSPSGYYDAGNYSCAADLAILAHADLEQPRIASVVHTYSAVVPFPIKGGKLYLYNNNPLLIYGYPGTTGLKTGFTEAAGRCLVGTAERDGVRLGAIVLDSQEPGTQDRELLDAGFHDVYGQALPAEAPFPPGA